MADILMHYPCAHTQKQTNYAAFSFKPYLSFSFKPYLSLTGTSLGESS